MKLIAGLGNPGREYEGTRHNVGFAIVTLLASRHRISVTKRNFRSVYGEGSFAGERLLLVRPMTYMNSSGEAVGALARFYKIDPVDIIIILDEIALEPGRLRLRYKGSAGGHNGLKSVLQVMGTQEIPRIRVGVGGARTGQMIDHVLSHFSREELPLMEEAYERAADAVEYALENGFEQAMNRYNVSVGGDSPVSP